MATKYFRGSNITFWLLIPVLIILIVFAFFYGFELIYTIMLIIILALIIIFFLLYNLLFVRIKNNDVHIPGFELRRNNVSNSYYYVMAYPTNTLIYNFDISNVKSISIVNLNKIYDEIDRFSSYYASNKKRTIYIQFKKPLKGLCKGLFNMSISDYPDIDKIYFSVASPEKLVDEIKSLMKV
jgi:hypothetical protein